MPGPAYDPAEVLTEVFEGAAHLGIPIFQVVTTVAAHDRGVDVLVVARGPLDEVKAAGLLARFGIGPGATSTRAVQRTGGLPYVISGGRAVGHPNVTIEVMIDRFAKAAPK